MAKRKITVPAADKGIYAALSESYRRGDLYAFSYDGRQWTTWETAADWSATERRVVRHTEGGPKVTKEIRDPAAAARGHGPRDWDRDHLATVLGVGARRAPTRLTKVQLVKALRAIEGKLPREAVELLNAA